MFGAHSEVLHNSDDHAFTSVTQELVNRPTSTGYDSRSHRARLSGTDEASRVHAVLPLDRSGRCPDPARGSRHVEQRLKPRRWRARQRSRGSRQPTFRELLPLRHYLYMADADSGLDETSLRKRLKRDTAAVHQHLEDQLGLLEPGLDVHRYRRVLERFYGFYVPVEMDVARLAAVEPLGFPLRARAELIARDLLALGLS